MYVGDFPLTALLDAQELGHAVGHEAPVACPIVEYGQDWRADSDDARVLIFTSSPLSLELEVMAGHVVGQIVPPGPGEILVETSDGAPSMSRPTTSASSNPPGGCAARSACGAIPRRAG